MHSEYRWVLAHLDALPEVRAVVVTGTPPAFCVGGDSAALAGHAERGAYDAGLSDELATPGYGVAPEFDADFAFQFAMRFPIIAAVNGAGAGVGLALALFCDLRFAAAAARLTTAAPKLGLPAEYGMSWQLPRLVGVTRAADLLQHSPAAAIHEAQRLLEQAMTTAEYREGVAALLEKRPPSFP